MQERTSENQAVKKSVAPFSADHGVNPGWGVYEERPAIPAFNGVAEIARLAMVFTLWSRIESFLYDEVGLEPLTSWKEEKKHRAVLLESETYLIALLCLLNNEHYSAGGLVDAMVGVDASADQRGNARKRILNRTLPIVGDRYGLIDYSERHMGNSMEYSICRSARLVEFAETHLLNAIGDLMGGGQTAATDNTPKNKKTAPAKSASRKKAVTPKAKRSDKTVTGKAAAAGKSGSKKLTGTAGGKATGRTTGKATSKATIKSTGAKTVKKSVAESGAQK